MKIVNKKKEAKHLLFALRCGGLGGDALRKVAGGKFERTFCFAQEPCESIAF